VVVEGDGEEEGPELHKETVMRLMSMRMAGLVGSLAGRTAQAKNTHPNGQGTCPAKSSNFILDLRKTLRRPE
nr:60S ribosomal protein L17-2-like [Tanacetum cinerariifolium]